MNWLLMILVSSVLLVHWPKCSNGQKTTGFNSTAIPRQGVNSTTTLPPAPPKTSNINTTVTTSNVNTTSIDKVRIVGGVETAEHEFPFIVSLTRGGSHFCGGTIIHKEWIITAAHCMTGLDFQVKAGEHNIENAEGTEQIVAPTDIVIHPKYNASTFENDIAIVRINPSFQFDGNVKAFLLPTRQFVASGYATAAGWGTTSEGSHLTSPVLRKVSVPIVENIECGKQYGRNFDLLTMLCAGESEGNKDSCQGDSGGPLMCTHLVQRPGVSALQNESTLCGIVSYGYGCARKGYAGVYTRVSFFMDWIEERLYGKNFVDASKERTTKPPSKGTVSRKPPFSLKKSSVTHIHVSSNSTLFLHIFTACFMFILNHFVIFKL